MCFNGDRVFGAITTPAHFDSPDSIPDAWDKIVSMLTPVERQCASIAWRSSFSSAPISKNPSTNSFNPRSVGTRPADVCGDASNPADSKSDITLRIVAEDSEKSSKRDNVFDPTGSPDARYASTSDLKMPRERAFNSDNVEIFLLIMDKCSNRVIKRQQDKSILLT